MDVFKKTDKLLVFLHYTFMVLILPQLTIYVGRLIVNVSLNPLNAGVALI